MRTYVALGTYLVPGTGEALGDPLVVEDDDGARWMLARGRREQFPFPEGHDDELREIKALGDVTPPEFGLDLVGVAEIADLAGVSRDSIERWRGTTGLDFPSPLADLASGPVWSWQAVERWLQVARVAGRPAAPRDPKHRWAAGVREGDFVLFQGRRRRVLGVRRNGRHAPYFRFDASGVSYSYVREEVGPLSS